MVRFKVLNFVLNLCVWPIILFLDMKDGDFGNFYSVVVSTFLSTAVTNFIAAIIMLLKFGKADLVIILISAINVHLLSGIVAHFAFKEWFGNSFFLPAKIYHD